MPMNSEKEEDEWEDSLAAGKVKVYFSGLSSLFNSSDYINYKLNITFVTALSRGSASAASFVTFYIKKISLSLSFLSYYYSYPLAWRKNFFFKSLRVSLLALMLGPLLR